MPFARLPDSLAVGRLDPPTVVALCDEFCHMPREASLHECRRHHMLAVAGLRIIGVGLLVGLRDDQVVGLVFQMAFPSLRCVLPHPGDERFRGAVADRRAILGPLSRLW